jgi:hypothetical protein
MANKNQGPEVLKRQEVSAMTLITELLKPLASFTDLLQGDGITSSLAIGAFCHAIEGKCYDMRRF